MHNADVTDWTFTEVSIKRLSFVHLNFSRFKNIKYGKIFEKHLTDLSK